MNIETSIDAQVNALLLHNYFSSLVNRFFKIIPIREDSEPSLPVYMRSLQRELIGCSEFIPELGVDPLYLTLLATLEYLIDTPDCEFERVRSDVFRAIGICKQLQAAYGSRG